MKALGYVDAGGCREPVDATGGGLIYSTREELYAALSRLAYEPGLREALARRAREGFLRLLHTAASPQKLPGSRGIDPARQGSSLRFRARDFNLPQHRR